MTNTDLANAILSIKNEYLGENNLYRKSLSIGNTNTSLMLKESLVAVDLYLKILEYYQQMTDKTISPITDDEINLIIAEADKLLDTYIANYVER